MKKPWKSLLLVGLALAAVGGFYVAIRGLPGAGAKQDGQLKALLREFDMKIWSEQVIDPESMKAWLRKRDEVAARVRALGTNILPELMEEVKEAGVIEKTNPAIYYEVHARLQLAFEALGPRASPLLPELIKELQSGKSVLAALTGIIEIATTEGGLAIVAGLTNADARVRLGCLRAIPHFRSNAVVVEEAWPLVLKNLDSDSPEVRAAAASALGDLRAKPEVSIPALVRVAESDEDAMVRTLAVDAIQKFNKDGAAALSVIERIASSDPVRTVRAAATNAVRRIRSELSN